MNPVLVEATRGDRVESRHRGAAVAVDADGAVVFAAGEIDAPVYPRSAVKAMLALPLVESGAADRLGLTEAELALACASHAGEPAHVEAAAAMLRRAGLGPEALECGAHWPLDAEAARALAASGRSATALHNNCSGKHAGFLCLACDRGEDPAFYVRPEHPVMREVTAALAAVTGARLEAENRAIDGCAIPTYAIPLRALALGFARFGTGRGLPPVRAAAAARLRRAVAAHPFMVGGTGRFDTRLIAGLGPRVFSKTGAEGVFGVALPELGLGLAVKCDDGAGRAAEVMTAALVARLLRPDGAGAETLAALAAPELRNWNGTRVGALRAAGPLA
ncbi:MAG TPA: asparaginase [Acetobacteraceae bacterium]|nr:asparaginase [Acetobacteraceae bacterium]